MNGDTFEFFDTNVLLYAHDVTAGAKRTRAVRLLDELIADDRCRLSTQVLSEFYVNVTRKLPRRLGATDAADLVSDLAACVRRPTTADDVTAAIQLAQSRQLSFWDAMVVVAALRADAEILWSEDLQDGSRYGSLEVRNPFVRPD